MTSDDEPLVLSANALAALAEFHAERDAHESKFNELKAQADQDAQFSMDAFEEDWNKSQFWYSDETAELLADQLLSGTSGSSSIGVISTPSVFVALRNKLRDVPLDQRPRVVLLEHDDRFAVFPEFVFYDYQQPLKLPGKKVAVPLPESIVLLLTGYFFEACHAGFASLVTRASKLTERPENMKGSLDRVICDPPFLNEDCQTKAALTVRWLLKSDNSTSTLPRVIVCTGERMEHVVTKLYRSLEVRTTNYEPKHARGLSNEFYCYANFDCSAWTWKS
ncbi:hypothetical protein E4U53_005635 [Claviceps sorghi]|nr:hypothetical protein E4U53_005635 [Claviceps sorghi]